MSKIEKLASLCKASIHVTFNEHRTNYESVEEYVRFRLGDRFDQEKPEDLQAMIDNDLLIEVQFYTSTPVGFYLVMGANLDKLLDEAISIAVKEQS